MIQFFNQSEDEKTKLRDFAFCPFCGNRLPSESGSPCGTCGFVQYKNPLPGISVLIENPDRKLLVGKRKYQADSWCLPCGFIESNENFLTAAHREVKEETGLDIRIAGIVNVVSNIINPQLETLVIVLLAQVIGGVAEPGDDIVDLQWVDAQSIPRLAFQADAFIMDRYFQGGLKAIAVDRRYA